MSEPGSPGEEAAASPSRPEIDVNAIIRATPTKRGKAEPLPKFLARITHLSLNGKGISRLVRLPVPPCSPVSSFPRVSGYTGQPGAVPQPPRAVPV